METKTQAETFRCAHTGRKVTATESRWDCDGCGKGRDEENAQEFAERHAQLCTIFPLG
ncbi:hypothetical protein H181DRAFT_03153 [Streptomyces sp. WMMB 714]|uniref:hypothetical protein n=1 Tax=Streptomyces sp. WMMB 714 TaxID=1286822 RepID=UPI000823D307|nr:hypothetical protein [Streptomyces sp. WMMB 714]SCK37275.1 hypothetical protein H181DRAFT_03153 [Streptomyces sp. WMMB 714]